MFHLSQHSGVLLEPTSSVHAEQLQQGMHARWSMLVIAVLTSAMVRVLQH